MILGFFGKGGSGKSSVSSQMALFLNQEKKSVLAIDADHNMDLSYNLTAGELIEMQYLGTSLNDIKKHLGLSETQKYTDVFLAEENKPFTLFPFDEVTKKYSVLVNENLYLMAAGPQTDTVLYGKACSHSLATALKVYLPLLSLKENEVVIVDEKAGADGVTTGIVTGIDMGVIVCEPALHSIKAAKQIAELMDFYKTPYIFVGNKISNTDDEKFISSTLGFVPTAYLSQSSTLKRNPSNMVAEWRDELASIVNFAPTLIKNDRLSRTKEKFVRNHNFSQH
jgi:CO dehydrogenase maturation factor